MDLSSVESILLLKELRKRYDVLTSPSPGTSDEKKSGTELYVGKALDKSPVGSSGVRSSKKVIFLGPPGSGKGTQSEFLMKKYGLCHISTGDILREMARDQSTELSRKIKATMEKGALVSDEVITEAVKKTIEGPQCQSGYILDGFPRSLKQAESLEEDLVGSGSQVDGVFFFDVPHTELLRRITGRRVHLPSGRVYHTEFSPPKVPNKDDLTGEDLSIRKDDTEETLKTRLNAFNNQTAPLIEFYNKRGLLRQLDALAAPQVVSEQIKDFIDTSTSESATANRPLAIDARGVPEGSHQREQATL